MQLIIINGPNLNLLGKREIETYGTQSFEEYFSELQQKFGQFSIDYYQSNIEGELINKIHECGFNYDGIILNAGGYSHTSVAIADAIASVVTPVVEVHISNVFAREEYRHTSFITSKCAGIISGFGMKSYELALLYLSKQLK